MTTAAEANELTASVVSPSQHECDAIVQLIDIGDSLVTSHYCVTHVITHVIIIISPVWGRGTPLPLLSIYFLIFSPFYFSLSFIGFTYFVLLSIPSLSTRIVPLRFQAGGRRRRPNLGLVSFFVCVICVICIP